MTVIERLTERDFNGYLRRRIPHELDQLVESVIDDYLGASSGIRASMRERLSPRSASVLTVYGQRAASMAVRKGSTEFVYRGLIGIGLGYEREDDKRQSLYPLVALYDSAQRLGVSFIELVERAAGKIPEAAAEALLTFDSRSERDKSLRAMGIAAIGDGRVLIHEFCPAPVSPHPGSPEDRVGRRLSQALDRCAHGCQPAGGVRQA